MSVTSILEISHDCRLSLRRLDLVVELLSLLDMPIRFLAHSLIISKRLVLSKQKSLRGTSRHGRRVGGTVLPL